MKLLKEVILESVKGLREVFFGFLWAAVETINTMFSYGKIGVLFIRGLGRKHLDDSTDPVRAETPLNKFHQGF